MRRPTLFILRQTDAWIAVNKPAGLAVIPGRAEQDTVIDRLSREIGRASTGKSDPRLRVVHRLDKPTSGVLLFALHLEAQRHLCRQFLDGTVRKQYLALVAGRVEAEQGEIDAAIGPHPSSKLKMAVVRHGGRPAVTRYSVVERYRFYTLLRCFPLTGRTHQIRVHLAHIHHPLAIDPLYAPARDADGLYLSRIKRDFRPTRGEEERLLIGRVPLHAERLAFAGLDGQPVELDAEPPKDFRAITNMLARHGR